MHVSGTHFASNSLTASTESQYTVAFTVAFTVASTVAFTVACTVAITAAFTVAFTVTCTRKQSTVAEPISVEKYLVTQKGSQSMAGTVADAYALQST